MKMKQEVRTMLENTYDLFTSRCHDPLKAWDRFIEYIAVDNYALVLMELNHNFEWLFQDKLLVNELPKIYDNRLLRTDYYDHLGEIYFKKVLPRNSDEKKNLCLVSADIADYMVKLPGNIARHPIKILDTKVGTGRSLMAAYKKCQKSILFGVDKDIRLLRIAFANFAIHDIPGYLLNADYKKHEIDICKEDGKYNWKFSNYWSSNLDKLRPSSSYIEASNPNRSES